MIKFAVINLKSTIKNLIKIIIVLIFIIGIVNISDLIKNNITQINFINLVKNQINFKSDNLSEEGSLSKLIISEMPVVTTGNNTVENNTNEKGTPKIQAVVDNEEVVKTVSVNEDLRNLPTSVISENNISENYNTIYDSVKIKNETSFELSQDVLVPDIEYTNKEDIIIFHTHTCESYTATDAMKYTPSRKL